MSLSAVQKALAGVGALFIAATWLFVVVARPTDWSSVGASSQALITLGGYVTGAVLLLVATVPALPARLVSMIPVALVLNIVVGQIIGSVGIPLYLDSTGTVLVAALAGPWAGIATGVLSSLVWSAFNPSVLPFAATSAAVGWLAGVAIKHGALKNIATVLLSGAVIGIIIGMLAAPIAAFVYGGTAGVGTGTVVLLLREMGHSLLQSVTLQSFMSDPLDKALVMLLVWLVLKSLPKRTLAAFR